MADELDYLLNWQNGQPLEAPKTQQGSILGDTYEGVDYKKPLDNTLFVTDMRGYFAERGITDKTDEELYNLLLDDSNYRDLNTLAPFFGVRGSQSDLAKNSKTDDSLRRAARLHQFVQNAPSIFSEDGRSISEAGPSIAGAIVTDPVNWALGAVEAASFGAATPAVAGARAGLAGGRAATSGLVRGGVNAAKIGAAEGALTGAISDYGMQGIEQELGLSDETSIARLAESAALGAGVSAAAGGLFGAVGGAIAGRRGGRAVEGLRAKGYNDAEIESVLGNGEAGMAKLAEMEPDIYRQAIEDQKAAALAASQPAADPIKTAQDLENQRREIRIASHLGPLSDHLSELRERLASLQQDNEVGVDGVGYLDDQINETLDQIANLEEARHFPASIENRQKIIEEMFRSPDLAKREQARQMARTLAEDRARYEQVMASNVPEDISAFISGRVSNNDALAAGRRFDAEDTSLDEAARKAALRTRQQIVAADAKTMASAEGVVAKDSGELAKRTDSATKDQARLTADQVSSADAAGILEQDLADEAAAMQAEQAAKAAVADPAAQQAAPAEVATTPAPAPIKVADPSKIETAPVEEAPAQAKVVPVTPATRNRSPNGRASKSAAKMAIDVGVDVSEVKGTGKDGRVLASDITQHVEENGASQTYIDAVGVLADVAEHMQRGLKDLGVDEQQISSYLSDREVFFAALRGYNQDVLGNVYDMEAVASLMDIFDSQMDRGSATFKAPDFRNKTEQSVYNNAVKAYVAKGRTEKEARLAASMDLARDRKAEIDKTKVDPRMVGAANPSSTLGRMDNASPIPVDEAGNPLIRLQSLLRTGRAFADAKGGEYSIVGKTPDARTLHYDDAATRARNVYESFEKIEQERIRVGRPLTEAEIMAGRILKPNSQTPEWQALAAENFQIRSPIMPFVAKGTERVRDSKNRAAKGAILYVSGKSGKVFTDWRNAFADLNVTVKSDKQPPWLVDAIATLRSSTNKSVGLPAKEVARQDGVAKAIRVGKPAEVARPAAPAAGANLSLTDFLSSLAELAGSKNMAPSATAPAGTGVDLPALEKNGKRAFFINRKTGEVRAAADYQITRGDTAKNILGKSSPDDWDVEYHDKSYARSKSGLASARAGYADDFRAKTKETVKPKLAKDLASETFTPSLVPELAAAVESVNTAIRAVAATPGVDPFFGLMSLPANFTGRDLMAISDVAHKLPLSGVNKASLSLMKAIAEAENLIAPMGVRQAEALRDQSIASVRSIFAKVPDDVVAPIIDLLSGLADGKAPKIASTSKSGSMFFNADQGTIYVPGTSLDKGSKVPQSFVFFHEIGHWAHLNLLSSADRAEFWDWAVKNLPDEQAVARQLGIDPSKANREAASYLTNYYSSPAEFFAESFARWATGRLDTASNSTMWQRFAKYVKGIYDTIINRKHTTDRELEQLFLKILPDRKAEEIADNLDAIQNGAKPIEAITVGRSLREPPSPVAGVDSEQSLAARPDYMSLPMEDLLEMGEAERAPFIEKLKQVSDQVDDVQRTWEEAVNTLDPETAFDAYRKTQTLLIGSATTLEEKRKYLASVAKATGRPLQSVYSRSDEAFSPFNRYLSIVPRAKKMRRMMSMARTGRVQAMDSNDLVDLSAMPDYISEAEAIEGGLSKMDDPTKAARALLETFTGREGQESAGFARLLSDMKTALNSAYEQTGIIPKTSLLDEAETPAELRAFQIGRFNSVTVGDIFKRSGNKESNWTVEAIADDLTVTMRQNNGEVVKVTPEEFNSFSRLKSGTSGKQVEVLREQRMNQMRELRDTLKRQRIDEARKVAFGKLSANGTLPANPGAASVKELPEDVLLKRVTSNTSLADDAAQEVISRDLAKPYQPGKVMPSAMDDAREGIKNIRGKILDGDDTVDNDVAAFLATGGHQVKLSPRNKAVNLAIREESMANAGGDLGTDVGVPPRAGGLMTALLSDIEHRSKRAKYTARTMLYRAIKMGYPESDSLPDIDVLNVESEAWKGLRGRVKSLAEAYAGGGGSADDVLRRTVSLVYDLNPAIKQSLDELDYNVGDAVELVAKTLGLSDEVIERGERRVASDLLDSVGYLVNGLIHNDDLRGPLSRLTYFNDLFDARRSDTPDVGGVSNLTMTGAVPFSAGNLTPSKLGIDASVMSRQGYNDLVLLRSDGEIVASPYDGFVSFKDLIGPEVETKGSAETFYGNAINDRKKVMAVAAKADSIRSVINAVKGTDNAKAERLKAVLDEHLSMMEDMGVKVPRFSVMAVKARTPFDTATVFDSQKMVQGLRDSVVDAVEEGDIPADAAAKIDQVLATLQLGQNGDRLYEALDQVLTGDFTADDFIQSLGYDSIKDKFGQIRKVFDKDQMVEADQFMSSIFHAPEMPFDDAPNSKIGELMNASMLSPVGVLKSFRGVSAAEMTKKVDDHGMKHWLLNLGRNRFPRRSDAVTPIRMKYKWLGSNAKRMRSAGMVTLGDWFENHFPWVQQEFSRRLLGTKDQPGPLRAIRSLSDAPSKKARWLANSTGRNLKIESHTKILNALIEPSNTRLEAMLSDEERGALKVVRDSMTSAFMDLRKEGVMMGSRGRNYFPQIWSQKAIRKDIQGAIEGFQKYFEIEGLKVGRPVDADTARNKATNLVATLAEVDGESFYDPDVANIARNDAENIDSTRKIELDRHPEALKHLKPFLEDDLESYLTKYFDQVAHRLSIAKKFGHRNHGFGEYLGVVVNGREGIAKLLSTRRTQEHSTFAMTPEDGLVDVSFTESYPMPFETKPHLAVNAADEVIDIHRKLGPEQARRYLMNLAVPDPANGGKPSSVYARRVDAIVDALRDFNGEARNLNNSDAKFLMNAMKVANRRPLIGDTTYMTKTAKNLRAFNSLTLLSYTTIASLGDAMLPVVRSGDFRSSLRAWGKYMSDPDYRQAMANVGAGLESLLHNRMTHMTGTPANRLTSAFFSATGLTPWTDEARTVATAVGLEALKTAQIKAVRDFNPALPMSAQSTAFRQNFRLLKRYGLEDYATRQADLGSDAVLNSEKMRVALMRFVDDSVFSPNGNDVPIWAQTPWGAVMFQLKSFPLMMQRMAREVLYDDLRLAINDKLGRKFDLSDVKGTGNVKRAAYLLTLMPVMGYGTNTIMDLARGRGGEENNEHAPASRTLSDFVKKFPGYDDKYQQGFGELEQIVDRETLDEFAGQYLSGFFSAAGLGLVTSMLTDAASQAENGSFGTERMLSTVFGPSMGTATSGWHVVQGVFDGNENSTYPERQALRETIRRVPILGGQNAFVESLIDEAIPESTRRKAKQATRLYGE